MARTFIRQDTQVRKSDSYNDAVAFGETMETGSVNIEDDLNALRSQVNRLIRYSSGNWYDDIPTINSKQRGVYELNTDLDDLEEKSILCGVQVLTNVTIPASADASGSMTAIAKASLVDGETFTLDDGINTATVFEFDVAGDGVGGGNTQVNVSTDTTDVEVASRMVSAINGVGSTLLLSADNSGGTVATVTITHTRGGSVGNVTTWDDTVTNAGFLVTQPTGGAGDVVVLDDSSNETPALTAAIGTGLGAVVAVLSTDVGNWASDLVNGANAVTPKNLVRIRDATTKDVLMDGDQVIYGLLQAESGVVQDDAFNDTDKQVQISFVIQDPSTDTLVAADAQYTAGQTIEYIYARRATLDTLPEDCAFPMITFSDHMLFDEVTLDRAIDNQGTTPVTMDTNIDIDMGAGVEWAFRDSSSQDLFNVTEGASGSTSAVNIGSDVDVYNNDALDVDFASGIAVGSSGTEISINETAGTITTAQELTVQTTGSNDLNVTSGNELFFDDTNQDGSSWTATQLKLSEDSAEWDLYKTNFGEVSLLDAINQAAASSLVRTRVYANVTSTTAADNDVGGTGGGANLDAQLPDMSTVTFVDDVDIFLNGSLLRPGVDAAANHDCYPGSDLSLGQLKFEFTVKVNDVICVVVYS